MFLWKCTISFQGVFLVIMTLTVTMTIHGLTNHNIKVNQNIEVISMEKEPNIIFLSSIQAML